MKLELLDQDSVCPDCGRQVTEARRFFITNDGGITGYWVEHIQYACGKQIRTTPKYIWRASEHKPPSTPMNRDDYNLGQSLCRHSNKYVEFRRKLDSSYRLLEQHIRITFTGDTEVIRDMLEALNHRSQY